MPYRFKVFPFTSWEIVATHSSTYKPFVIYEVVVGNWEEVFSSGAISVLISKENFSRLSSGKYSYKTTLPSDPNFLTIFDENGKIIPNC